MRIAVILAFLFCVTADAASCLSRMRERISRLGTVDKVVAEDLGVSQQTARLIAEVKPTKLRRTLIEKNSEFESRTKIGS